MQSANETTLFTLRQVLVHAILAGCNRQDAVIVLMNSYEIEYADIPRFLNACGVTFPEHRHTLEGITPDRRRQLQELSLSDE
jgi:hypothetical protein